MPLRKKPSGIVYAPLYQHITDTYKRYLMLKPEELSKGRILDVGAGARSPLSGSPEVKARVFSLDPRTERAGSSVKAIGQMVPFKSNSFDLVVSHMFVPYYGARFAKSSSKLWRSRMEFRRAKRIFYEMLRVVKPGGRIKLSSPRNCPLDLVRLLLDAKVSIWIGGPAQKIPWIKINSAQGFVGNLSRRSDKATVILLTKTKKTKLEKLLPQAKGAKQSR